MGIGPAPPYPPPGVRQETEDLANRYRLQVCPVPSHTCNFSKMQIPLCSMQTRPKSQGCLALGPTTWTPPAWLPGLGTGTSWESVPVSQRLILSLPSGVLAPWLAHLSW